MLPPNLPKPGAVADYVRQAIPGLLLALVLSAAWFCYQPGLDAAFHYDDTPNLSNLENVNDSRSALRFITGGQAGPLGRPLSLATFIPQKHAWPDSPDVFLRTNILIHLLNGLLLAWLAFRILSMNALSSNRATYAAVLTAGIWLLLPILASTSLLVIQRMTSLSALFVLSGLVSHMLLRSQLANRPRLALIAMTISLVVFTILAALSKENGALLPALTLVIEATLLTRPRSLELTTWRRWCIVFLWLPTAAVAIKMMSLLPYSQDLVAMRGFGGWERLITQAQVLWEYLFHAFIPIDTLDLGPFHDTYQSARSIFEPLTFLAASAWVLTIGFAVAFRKTFPVISFAVLWFVVGHSVESTVASLDLYFEHRNYLPLIGPCLALAWLAVKAFEKRPLLTTTVTTAYVILLATTLWVVSSLWSEPLHEAQEHYLANPHSSRAIGHFGGQLLAVDAVGPTILLLDQAIQNGVAPERLKTTKLYLTCAHRPTAKSPIAEELASGLHTADFDRNLAHAIYVLTRTRLSLDCKAATISTIRNMINALSTNPTFSGHAETRYWIHRARERLADHENDRTARKYHLLQAQKQRFDPFTIDLWISLQLENGQAQKACERLQEIWADASLNPIRRINRWLVVSEQAARISHDSRTECSMD